MAIILAGGYAKRLWPLTTNKPKPLLNIAGKPIIDYVLEAITSCSPIISKVIVLTNLRFRPQFQSWARSKEPTDIEILSDDSLSEEEKPGALGALASVGPRIDDDFLVVAGDCIYPGGLRALLELFCEKDAPVVGVYYAGEADQVERGSAVELSDENVIVGFVEKPEYPATDLVGAVVYAFPRRIKDRLKEYSELELPRDEPGRFIEWLHKKETVYGFLLDGVVWDIGTLRAYEEISRTSGSGSGIVRCNGGRLLP